MGLRQDRVLGALLGMGIGDALGMPVEGWTRERISERFGTIDRYYPRTFDDGAELGAGEFTDDSEGVLCIIESFTASSGEIDPDNILARMQILARGEARRWMNPSTFEAINREDGVPSAEIRVTGDVAARGIPLGLIAAGRPNEAAASIDRWAPVLAQLTHSDPLAAASISVTAHAVRAAALGEIASSDLPGLLARADEGVPLTAACVSIANAIDAEKPYDEIAAELGLGDDAVQVVSTAVTAVALSSSFEDGVYLAATAGGASDSRGAIAGAILGAIHGTAGIPQTLIDGLEGRMYIMLAAPWFFQTIQLKSSFWRSGTSS